MGGQNVDFARGAVHGDVHKKVEGNRDGVGADAVLFEGGAEVAEAAPVRLLVPVDNPKRIGAARREQEMSNNYAFKPIGYRIEE